MMVLPHLRQKPYPNFQSGEKNDCGIKRNACAAVVIDGDLDFGRAGRLESVALGDNELSSVASVFRSEREATPL
jgi:hypothetical protein